jgi:two-component system LytT family sensor kinase
MDDYMYLQQMRFGQRIKYMCDVDKECMDELVPAFVLQPLIENAIIHGLSSSSKGGLIYVRKRIKCGCPLQIRGLELKEIN